MTRDQLEAQMAFLERKLKARTGNDGYADNVKAIKERLAELGRQLKALDD